MPCLLWSSLLHAHRSITSEVKSCLHARCALSLHTSAQTGALSCTGAARGSQQASCGATFACALLAETLAHAQAAHAQAAHAQELLQHHEAANELLWPEPFSRLLHVEALADPEPSLPLCSCRTSSSPPTPDAPADRC